VTPKNLLGTISLQRLNHHWGRRLLVDLAGNCFPFPKFLALPVFSAVLRPQEFIAWPLFFKAWGAKRFPITHKQVFPLPGL